MGAPASGEADGSEAAFEWMGKTGAQLKVPAHRALPFTMTASASSDVVARCQASTLDSILAAMLASSGGGSGQLPPAAPHSVNMSAEFPYRGNAAKPWPLCNDVPQQQEQRQARPGPSTDGNAVVDCRVAAGCGKSVQKKAMRLHVARHILLGQCSAAYRLKANAAEACGFCGGVCTDRTSGTCRSELVKGSTSSIQSVKSVCPLRHKLSLHTAQRGR
jgi:hypothetical protein